MAEEKSCAETLAALYPDLLPEVLDIYTEFYGAPIERLGKGFSVSNDDLRFLERVSQLVSHYKKHMLGEHDVDGCANNSTGPS
jgi:hypothetical protein